MEDPYIREPVRRGDLKYHSVTPCNAEASEEALKSFLTDNDDYYVRNHGPVPVVENVKNYEVEIGGKPVGLESLSEGGRYKFVKLTATMQCGGNRRGQFNSYRKTNGTKWGCGAISTAEWDGVLLGDVLRDRFTDKELKGSNHVHFEGIDGTLVSIPMAKALGKEFDVMLATRMNGEEIPRDHGYPIRVIVPGHVGVRNLKWLKSIRIAREEVDSMWQTGVAYKVLPNWALSVSEVDIKKIEGMMEMPVQSFVTSATRSVATGGNGAKVKVGGLAWSGGGRSIVKVEVSFDEGRTWREAKLLRGVNQDARKSWAWVFWSFEGEDLNLGDTNTNTSAAEVMCRATDFAGNQQPGEIKSIWNLRGLANNTWHSRHFDEEGGGGDE